MAAGCARARGGARLPLAATAATRAHRAALCHSAAREQAADSSHAAPADVDRVPLRPRVRAQVSCLDLESLTWQTLQVDGQPPLRRACHSAGAVGKRLYIVGGRYWDISEDDYIFMNDIQLLDTAAASTFAADWRAYFNNSHLSDIELRVEGRAIPAHRVVLAARCEYFARLLLSGMREAQGGVIDVDGVRYDIFVHLLDYLYTDALDFPPESALELLTAADRYGLDRLKRECVSSVEACLRTCTVCHVLTVADQHLAEDLKEVRPPCAAATAALLCHCASHCATASCCDAATQRLAATLRSGASAPLQPPQPLHPSTRVKKGAPPDARNGALLAARGIGPHAKGESPGSPSSQSAFWLTRALARSHSPAIALISHVFVYFSTQVCLNFITSNFPEVIRTNGFHSLSRDLLEQVHRAMASRHYPDKEAKLEKQGSPASAGRNSGSSSGSRLSIRQLAIGGMSPSHLSSANGSVDRHSLDSDAGAD